MLCRITSKNRLTLPRSITEAMGPAEYFNVEARDGQIVLTPVRIQHGHAARARLADRHLNDEDITAAVNWPRQQ